MKEFGGPTHLHGLGKPVPVTGDSDWWPGRNGQDDVWFRRLECRCGADGAFEVWSAGDQHPDWVGGEVGGTRRVELRCVSCGTAALLFDDGLHGYNAVVCGDRDELPDDYLAANQALLAQQACGDCGGSAFEVVAQAIFDLYDEDLAEIPEHQWDDSFGSFTAVSRCVSCAAVAEIAGAETA